MIEPFFHNSPEDIHRVSALLHKGFVVALPTETVYGLAADASNAEAVRQIFEIKGRPLIDPLIVHIYKAEEAPTLVDVDALRSSWAAVPGAGSAIDILGKLARAFWPGPLTLVLPKLPTVSDLVTAGRPSVAIRVPAHPLMRAVLKETGLALAAPSANPFGYISPTTAEHVRESLGEKVPYILDGGPCERGLESTILDLTCPEEGPRLLREGPISREKIEQVLGRPVKCWTQSNCAQASKGELAPGSLHRHYSPSKPLYLYEKGELPGLRALPENAVRVYLRRSAAAAKSAKGGRTFWLTEDGSLDVAARSLFALLRRLDESPRIGEIHWELPPKEGIGSAIRDRLTRAAAN